VSNLAITNDPLDAAEAEEKRARRLRREGKDKEAIETYERARELYAETGLQYEDSGNNAVMRAIKRCNAIVSNIKDPKGKRPAAKTARPNCLACSKPLPRFKYDGKAFDDGTPREWGAYGDNRFCTLTCGWSWACRHAPMPKKGKS
jgi:hypothetical protein